MADFKELYKVLTKRTPSRPVLFEFYLNERLYRRACGDKYETSGAFGEMLNMVHSFEYYGYDYATVRGSEYWFHTGQHQSAKQKTVSLNSGQAISDRVGFDRYCWMDAASCDYSGLDRISNFLPQDFKVIVMGPGGVLENVINLMGYDNLCFMLYEDRQLVHDVFEKVGTGLLQYYARCACKPAVGALISNDDWGFNTQTLLSPADMREFVFPWHKKIVDCVHDCGKPVILHSCGNYEMIFEDLLALGYDARHSYEDKIVPVETAYEQFVGKMAVLGGIDVDYLIHTDVPTLQKRCIQLLSQTKERGGFALGSGNSIPDYVPDEQYLAMIACAKMV